MGNGCWLGSTDPEGAEVLAPQLCAGLRDLLEMAGDTLHILQPHPEWTQQQQMNLMMPFMLPEQVIVFSDCLTFGTVPVSLSYPKP